MLTQRQKQILQAIVRQYTATGQPVGSKVLADKLPIKVSSATIRNEMAVLEREGFVKKEHSSSVAFLPSRAIVITLTICLIQQPLLIVI